MGRNRNKSKKGAESGEGAGEGGNQQQPQQSQQQPQQQPRQPQQQPQQQSQPSQQQPQQQPRQSQQQPQQQSQQTGQQQPSEHGRKQRKQQRKGDESGAVGGDSGGQKQQQRSQQPHQQQQQQQKSDRGGQSGDTRQQGAWGGQSGDARQQGAWGGQSSDARQQGAWGGQSGDARQQGAWGRQPGGRQQQPGGGRQQQPGGDRQQQPGGRQQQPGGDRQQQPGGDRQQQPGGGQQQRHSSIGDHAQQSPQRQQQLPSSFSQMAISKSKIERGTLGRKDIVETNYLKMHLQNMPNTAYHYDVTITPDRPKKFMRLVFEQFCSTFLPKFAIAFDGKKSCYTVKKLDKPFIEDQIEFIDVGNKKIQYRVQIKETDNMEIDLNSLRHYFQDRVYDKPMRALQCLEVVLANPCHSRGVRAGRSFFTTPERTIDLFDGYELWTGLYQALILGDQPFLNVDISHKSFPSSTSVINYIKKNFPRLNLNSFPNDWDRSSIANFLKNLNIVYEPPKSFGALPKTFKVARLSDQPADALMFQLNEGSRLTVAAYFQQKNYRLQYPKMPCLIVGSTVRSNYLPLELCNIPPGQAINKKDESRQVQQMIRYAATSTNERKDKIIHMLNYFNHNDDSLLNAFGIRIDKQFIQVPMRILTSPMILYNANIKVPVRNGSWNMNNSTKFLMTKEASEGFKWAIIYHAKSRLSYQKYQTLADLLIQTASFRNVKLQSKPLIDGYDHIESKLNELKRDRYDLVIVVIPFAKITYAAIKQSAELQVGILTQCVKEGTIDRRMDNMLAQNILLKINTKLNGLNHKFDDQQIKLNDVMYLGADVTHPSPDQRHIPSVVGVAASHDKFGGCYNMQYRLQKSTVECIEDMEGIVMHHLNVYKQYQNRLPEHIIYYRDGVSDGQFPIIRNVELRGIRSACEKMKIKMKLTCIIVVKRHHTRFFPMKPVNRDDRGNKYNNVPPGTVVDQIIVHPNEVQFFMVSHQSIQGTAKPTRYNVIEDDANFNIDVLQALTNDLCHMFPRCNRVVSYPAPAYLAHLVASRGRVYLEGVRNFGELREEYKRRLIKADFMQRNPSFFV